MIIIPLFEVSVAVGGRPNMQISPTDYILHVTQRSDEVINGTLFVALKGQRVDGHDFVKEAEQKGAIAVIVETEVSNITIPQIIVPSTEDALGNLGRIWRCRLNIPLVAVTGSVGKTTTKELIAHVLDAKYKTHKSRKNYNNQLGVPIELLRLEKTHECSVVEFGMRDLNQINYLSKIARPNFAVVTNIGVSHLETLKTEENIAKAKAEIFEGVDYGATALLNKDDKFFDYIASHANCKVISFGFDKDADIKISEIELDKNANPKFKLNGNSVHMKGCVGKYNAYNAAIAFAIATEMGVSKKDIIEKLSSFQQPEKRGVVIRLLNGTLLLDSTYNAAPDSIIANLNTVSNLIKPNQRLVCIIGEMLELGSHSENAHKEIGKAISNLSNKVENLITVGNYAKFINDESKIINKKHFENSKLVLNSILDEIEPNDVILIQGSKDVNLDIIIDALENKFGVVKN